MVFVAKATARRVGVLAMFVGTAEADKGVYACTKRADWGQEEPDCKVDAYGLP